MVTKTKPLWWSGTANMTGGCVIKYLSLSGEGNMKDLEGKLHLARVNKKPKRIN